MIQTQDKGQNFKIYKKDFFYKFFEKVKKGEL